MCTIPPQDLHTRHSQTNYPKHDALQYYGVEVLCRCRIGRHPELSGAVHPPKTNLFFYAISEDFDTGVGAPKLRDLRQRLIYQIMNNMATCMSTRSIIVCRISIHHLLRCFTSVCICISIFIWFCRPFNRLAEDIPPGFVPPLKQPFCYGVRYVV